MARAFGRGDRVASQMQKELSFILQREIKEPRLGFITLNEVQTSKDLAVAKVYFTVLNADADGKAAQAKLLNALAPRLRHALGKRMRLRHVPELRFYYDESLDIGMRVSALLNEPAGGGWPPDDEPPPAGP